MGFWASIGTVAAAGLVPLLAWPRDGTAIRQEQVRASFELYLAAAALALVAWGTVFGASAIAGEREEDTLDLLLSSCRDPGAIVLGKLLAGLLYSVLLVFLTFPAAAVLHLLGGTRFGEMIEVLAFLPVLALIAISLGLRASIRSRRTRDAAARSMLPAALLALLALAVYGAEVQTWGGPALQARVEFEVGVTKAILLTLLVALVLWALAAAAGKLRSALPAPPIRSRGAYPDRTWLTYHLIGGSTPMVPDGRNPVFVQRVRCGVVGNIAFRRILFWVTFQVIVWVQFYGLAFLKPGETFPFRVLSVVAVPTALIVPALATLSLLEERERARLDLLRSTLLGAGEILRGVFGAALFGTVGIAVAGLVLMGIAAAIAAILGNTLLALCLPLHVLLAWGSAASFSAAAGIAAAVVARRAAPALVLAYVAAGAWLAAYLGMPASPSGIGLGFLLLAAGSLLGTALLLALAAAVFRSRWMRE